MKTTKQILVLTFIMFSLFSIAQVEIEKSKSTLTGKNKLLLESIPDSKLDHFNINFYNYFYGCDQGGNSSVCIEAELSNADSKLFQEITDEAYTYFIEKWKSKGVNVTCPSAAEIEATKQFGKDKNKGKAELLSAGTYTGGNKFAKYITVIPSNTNQVRKEFFGNLMIGNSQYFPTDFSGNVSSVNFHFDLNFINFRNGFGTKAFISGKPNLTCNSGGSIVIWVKAKNLAAGYSNEGKGGNDFCEKVDGSGTSNWKVIINPEKYKAMAVEMIKKSIDSQFAEYDANIAKEK